jgi:hypothetical protein
MTANIRDTVCKLYRAFNYNMGEVYSLYLDKLGEKKQISLHHYSLEDFFLSDKEILERYQDVILAYES